jgi:hypothetical protein
MFGVLRGFSYLNQKEGKRTCSISFYTAWKEKKRKLHFVYFSFLFRRHYSTIILYIFDVLLHLISALVRVMKDLRLALLSVCMKKYYSSRKKESRD